MANAERQRIAATLSVDAKRQRLATTPSSYAIELNSIELNVNKKTLPTHSKSNVENFFCDGCAQLLIREPEQRSALCAMKLRQHRAYPFARIDDRACDQYTGTLAAYLVPLMHVPSIRLPYCAICGRWEPIEQHHIVRRSAGELYQNGRKLKKPTITLCGVGNNLKDADGRYFCHGLVHHQMLHFKTIGGRLAYLITEEPCKELDSYSMEGWKVVE